MNSITLVRILLDCLSLLGEMETVEIDHLKECGNPTPAFWKSVTLRYNTFTLQLYVKEEGVKVRSSEKYLECSYRMDGENIFLINVYCIDSAREHVMRKYINEQFSKIILNAECDHSNLLTKEVLRYLTIADEIAKQALLCSSGDDYKPGYYSEIMIADTGITLKQINHWNARSIDHKKDYYMRNLEFYIPFVVEEEGTKLLFREEKIGKMRVQFSDNSSNKNKICGDRIRAKIDEEKTLFETSLE